MLKQDIKNRDDIYLLVNTFYQKVRKDEILGPIFNTEITNWSQHLNHLTTFWESSLFLKTRYLGNPITTHIKVDKNFNNLITESHFGIWINLWIETVNDFFEGDYAENAKQRARKMSTFIYLKIFEARG